MDPGTWAVVPLDRSGFEGRKLQTRTYWTLPAPVPASDSKPKAEDTPAKVVRRLLREAVRSHLLSDVPVGIFLSSGLDSNAIAVLCAEAGAGDINTFTVGLADSIYDESPEAARTAGSSSAPDTTKFG